MTGRDVVWVARLSHLIARCIKQVFKWDGLTGQIMRGEKKGNTHTNEQ